MREREKGGRSGDQNMRRVPKPKRAVCGSRECVGMCGLCCVVRDNRKHRMCLRRDDGGRQHNIRGTNIQQPHVHICSCIITKQNKKNLRTFLYRGLIVVLVFSCDVVVVVVVRLAVPLGKGKKFASCVIKNAKCSLVLVSLSCA